MNNSKFHLDAYSLIKDVPLYNIVSNLNNLYKDIKFEIKKINDVQELLELLSKNEKQFTYKNIYLARLNSEWSILFDDSSMSDGGSSNLYNFNRLFGYEGLRLIDRESGTMFTYYKGNKERVIYSIRENKWVFYQEGEPLDFEDINNYKKRKISERFNSSILHKYLNILGVTGVEDLVMKSDELYLAKKIVL